MVRILVVEDDEANQELISRFLRREGYEVIHAGDGKAGVEAALSQVPHLILMDLSLPVMDGWEAARHIKKNPSTRHIPIVALTANALAEDVKKAMEAGCDHYETKPVIYPRLMKKLKALIQA
jgi:two-component system, cell cycle response regulator DivK